MKLHLRFILIVPFLLQIFAVVGLTGWLSLRNGQKAVENIVIQLQREIGDRIEQHLHNYLQKPYIVNQNVLDAINLGYLNPEKPRSMDKYFLQKIRLFAGVSVIQVGNEKGEFYGINNFNEEGLIISIVDRATGYNMNGYATDSQGKMTQKLIVSIPNFDPRRRPWYLPVATQGKSIWSDIYAFRGSTQLAITLGTPIYNQNHKLRGVVATDLVLLDINRFLSKLKIGESGQTFILERSGLLVASSTREHPFYSTGKNQTLQRLPAINSQNKLTKLTAKFLQERFGDFSKISGREKLILEINGERKFLQIIPYQDKLGLDWLIVIVVPEKDFMAQINANTRTTILLCIVALGIASVLGICTSRWISLPILHLIQSAEAMSRGNLDQQVSNIVTIAELNTLSNAFNLMANQLNAAFANLEQKVQERTTELMEANLDIQEKNQHLQQTLQILQQTQAQLIQAEKMSSLGQVVAGIAHEINNPITFISGNINHAREYVEELFDLIALYERNSPHPHPAIQKKLEEIELEYLRDDLDKLFNSMERGSDRISKIILGLRNFSRLDESERKAVDLHEGLDSTLMILQHRLKANSEYSEIEIVKDYGKLSLVNCHASQINQVFLNILSNAIDALTQFRGIDYPRIQITTKMSDAQTVKIFIADNGPGMDESVRQKVFDPFFTTKPVGKGTGLGLSISYQIITEQHRGQLQCFSQPGKGATFAIVLPIL
ncbi:ATP-binding protein [Aerosakkonemataceae cyanobacterium BLCC-F50]|uniref:histidine kinase n=1 Tax=Floridaenema flaviceps BLCC-F50 TaxID=3153642 RepID=A0ABV4XU58_9CYAN